MKRALGMAVVAWLAVAGVARAGVNVDFRPGFPSPLAVSGEYTLDKLGVGVGAHFGRLGIAYSGVDYTFTDWRIQGKYYLGEKKGGRPAHGFFLGLHFGGLSLSGSKKLTAAELDDLGAIIPVGTELKASISSLQFGPTVGARWVWGHFTLGPELGLTFVSFDKVTVEAGGQKQSVTISLTGGVPVVNLGLGVHF